MTLGLGEHRRIGIDSNVIIYLVDDAGQRGVLAGRLLDVVAAGEVQGIMSTLVLTEVCSGPALAGGAAAVERVADSVRTLDNTTFVSLSADIATDAAVLRGWQGLSIADAIHLATARHAGATAFVTNDRRIRALPHLEVLYLDELDVA